MKLEKIMLRSFRGATKEVVVDFDSSKKITMLFGENGTGKSTIIDGFTAVCESSFGSLEDRSSAKDAKYLVSAGHKPSDLLVELHADGIKWTATLKGKKVQSSPQAPTPPQLRVLRRAQLFKFIEEAPAQRYERLKEFLETPGIDKSEAGLREAIKNIRSEINSLADQQVSLESSLDQMWAGDGQKGGSAAAWAKKVVAGELGELEHQNKTIEALMTTLSQFNTRCSELANLQDRLGDLQSNLKTQQEAFQQAVGGHLSGVEKLVPLLTASKNYIESENPPACPVCEKDFDSTKVALRIGERLSEVAHIRELLAAIEDTKRHVATISAQCDAAYNFADEHIKSLSTQYDSYASLHEHFDHQGIVKSHTAYTNSTTSKAPLVSQIESHYRLALQQLGDLRDKNYEIIKSYKAVKRNLEETDRCKKGQSFKITLLDILERALTTVESERKNFIQGILNDLSAEIKALYEFIHPGESISDVTLQLDPSRKGSLTWSGHFHTEADVPPQAYYSESHLDTLGICIWLALTKRFSDGGCIIILDDVLTSVDVVHLDRIIDLIDAQADHFGHIILTTHFRPWRDRYRKHNAANANINFIELKEWDREWGLIVGTCKPAVSELKGFLVPSNFERQQVASKAGILLEHLLDFLALKYALSVPRKASQDYTLGDLLSSFTAAKKKLLKVEHLDSGGTVIASHELQGVIDALGGFTWVRNQVGCHASAAGEEITDADVRAFGEKVVEFAELLICPDGGDLPNKNKSGGYWQSRKGRCRLHPLEMP